MNFSKYFRKVLLAASIIWFISGCVAPQTASTPSQTPEVSSPTPTLAAPTLTSTATLPPPPAKIEWWNHTVFYEVFVRSFSDSTTGSLANDGIGDLKGLIEKLDYLNDGNPTTADDLGVTGIWLMPVMQSPSYHGYDVTDYYTVEEDYGTNEDFKQFISEAHQRGIKVIIDLPINHTSSQHPWFIEARDNPESEKRNWYLWSETYPGTLSSSGQIVWHFSPTGYYYGLFWSEMPDLNFTNPAVTAEMENVSRYWLEDMGVDGFRLDAARHIIEEGDVLENTESTHEWWRGYRKAFKTADPEALAVGEVWSGSSIVATYVQGDELDLAFEFDLAKAILSGVKARKADKIQSALEWSYSLFGTTLSATFLTNHDMDRVMNELWLDADLAKLASSVLLTIPGVPFIYYGEEIGMTGEKPDEMIRTPMQWSAEEYAGFSTADPWEPVNADYTEKNVAAQSGDPSSLLSTYRNLIHLRLNHTSLQTGEYIPVDSASKAVLAFLRVDEEETLLVIINLSKEAVRDYDLSLAQGNFSGTHQPTFIYGGEGEPAELTANSQGGFDAYTPLPEIPVGGVVILQLQAGR